MVNDLKLIQSGFFKDGFVYFISGVNGILYKFDVLRGKLYKVLSLNTSSVFWSVYDVNGDVLCIPHKKGEILTLYGQDGGNLDYLVPNSIFETIYLDNIVFCIPNSFDEDLFMIFLDRGSAADNNWRTILSKNGISGKVAIWNKYNNRVCLIPEQRNRIVLYDA